MSVKIIKINKNLFLFFTSYIIRMGSKEKKHYVLIDAKGKDIEGPRYFSRSPAQAAKKGTKHFLGRKPGTVKLAVRQASRGRGHDKVSKYEITVTLVKAPPEKKMYTKDGKIRMFKLKKLS